MFTGLIEDVGTIAALDLRPEGARLRVVTERALTDLALGESVAVNGTCLTVVASEATDSNPWFEAELSVQTLRHTAFGQAHPGERVNLERALRLGDRLGGHLVQGHIDGVGTIVARERSGDGWDLVYRVPEALCGEIVLKGSITLDGVSLTVAALEDGLITVAIIPHTAEHTNLTTKPLGALVHVETDVIGKYVGRLLARGESP